jgi:CBS domain-containing protein
LFLTRRDGRPCDDDRVNSPAVLPEWIEPAPGSIGTYLVTDVPLCGPDMTVAALQTMLVGRVYESTVDVAVCTSDDGAACRLLGLIPLERVLSAAPTTLARDLMDPDPPVVLPGLNQEEAAWRVAHHGESSLAVVDPDGVFRGLVPPARLLTVMLTEHDQGPGTPRRLPDLGGVRASCHGRTGQGPALASAAVAHARPARVGRCGRALVRGSKPI